MRKLTLQIVSGILGLWLAYQFIPGVYVGTWKTLLLAGLFLGLINVFIKPILKFVTTPLRILTFGLFGLTMNMGIIWLVAYFFKELDVEGIITLFWTAVLLWGLSTLLHLLFPKKKT
jgi:putative membrane protein